MATYKIKISGRKTMTPASECKNCEYRAKTYHRTFARSTKAELRCLQEMDIRHINAATSSQSPNRHTPKLEHYRNTPSEIHLKSTYMAVPVGPRGARIDFGIGKT